MPQDDPATDKLDSWKEIAAYVGRDVRTVIRWEQNGGLPIYRVPVGQRQAVYAYRHEIDEWMKRGANGSEALASLLEIAAARPEWSRGVTSVPTPAGHSQDAARPPRFSLRIAIPFALVTLAFLGGYLLFLRFSPPRIVLDGEIQITGDNTVKRNLITDGRYLYFGETREGRIVLSRVSVHGGPSERIATPFVQAEPVDVTRDGHQLLVLAGEGQESERTLWIVRTDSGNFHRVGSLLCHTAAWSPDGRRIACGSGNSIYLTADEGTTSKLIHRFAVIPDLLRWSLDGKRLLILLRDPATDSSVVWEVLLSSPDYAALDSLVPAFLVPGRYGSVAIVDREDDAFLGDGERIGLLRRRRWPWQNGFTLTQRAGEAIQSDALAIDPAAQRLYMSRGSPGDNELDWYDRKSHQFRPFLPEFPLAMSTFRAMDAGLPGCANRAIPCGSAQRMAMRRGKS